MPSPVQGTSGLFQLTHGEIQGRLDQQKLFGLDELQESLFNFCKVILTADKLMLRKLGFYDLAPSVLLYGPPNTGKTSLCYFLFDRLKQKVTNEINFYTVDVGRMLDPALGQSSRNLAQIFDDLRQVCVDDSSAFLLLDELDAFCMSRSREQEHDAVRRAMTTLMLELDQLRPSVSQRLIVFGATNVPDLVDTAVVRRFTLKHHVNAQLSLDEFTAYLNYLNQEINYKFKPEDLIKFHKIYKNRGFTVGDIKNLYKILFIEVLCTKGELSIADRLLELFQQGFSTGEHLAKTYQEISNV
ncbi:MAG: AAA family ATPase [Limnoraphis sp.]